MSADISRERYNALRDFAGVNLKQGGVLLDADFNELVAVVDRRIRAMASDTLGRSTVSSATPDAFKLSVVDGKLLIATGRMYVDGMLAENHGAEEPSEKQFDPLLGEPTFSEPIPYDAQPYFPGAPQQPKSGRHLVYLDVWEREVTHIERPDLIEPAVGVETSSRKQIVWQVRITADDVGQADCSTPDGDIEGWESIIAPSTGRLTMGTYDAMTEADPCELPPSGAYTGLENQTYRVEIHDAGELGNGATFKWSRENASIASRVWSVDSDSDLVLESLGRDEFLRFNAHDWVEVTDDVREFSGRAGAIRKIAEVHEASRRITFTEPLPAEMIAGPFPNSDAPGKGNMRVKQWNQRGKVLQAGVDGATTVFANVDASSTGVIPVPAADTTLLLENGVTVTFASSGSTEGNTFRAGDYWVFAARTADASVELLNNEPPRGIHHHYARLGIFDAIEKSVTDCRTPTPVVAEGHDCSCTVCVTEKSHNSGARTIEAAVEQVRDSGGTICLGTGVFQLKDFPIKISGSRSVTIRGQGSATVIEAPNGAFDISRSTDLTIENLAIQSVGEQTAIRVRTVAGLHLNRLVIALAAKEGSAALAAITLSGVVAGARIRDNAILAPVGIQAMDAIGKRNANRAETPKRMLMSAELRIEDNILWCSEHGVALVGEVMHAMSTRITGNEIVRSRKSAISVLGASANGSSMEISRNNIRVAGAGIVASADGLTIQDNMLVCLKDEKDAGTAIAVRAGFGQSGIDRCTITGNEISGFRGAAIAIEHQVRDVAIRHNRIKGCGNGIDLDVDARAHSVSIDNNHLDDIGNATVNSNVIVGIRVLGASAAAVCGNILHRIGSNLKNSGEYTGVMTAGVGRVRVADNDISEIGPTVDNARLGAGVRVGAGYRDAIISGNQITRDPRTSSQPSKSEWYALLMDDLTEKVPVFRAGDFTAVRLDAARAIVLGTQRPMVLATPSSVDAAGAGAGAVAVRGASASVRGNVLSARGRTPAVQIDLSGDCIFSDNRCELQGIRGISAVHIDAGTTIVNANRVVGGQPSSISLIGAEARMTVFGNITSAGISPISAPWTSLNLEAP